MKESRSVRLKLAAVIGIFFILLAAAIIILPVSILADDKPSGDINGDGQVNILDLTLLKLMLAGKETPTEIADVDGNGRINNLDIDSMLNQIFGIASHGSHGGGGGGGGGGSPVIITTNQVSFNGSPYLSSYGPGATGHTFTARVNIAQTSLLYNGSFTIDYNLSMLQVTDVGNGLFSTCVINMTNGIDWVDAGGHLTVSPNLSACAVNGSGISGSGYLCDILFTTTSAGTSPLSFSNGVLYQIDGGNVSAINGTTWINSSAQITQRYSLNLTSSDHGNVTTPGEGSFPYDAGDIALITATPDSCYHFVNWTGDNGSVANPNAASTTITMNGDYSIQANFAINTYTLTSSAGSGGTISPLGATVVNCGSGQTYNITPNACYRIANVVVDGSSVGALTTYTFSNVQANHSINATFAIDTYTINSSAGPNGTISPLGSTVVNCGSGQTYNITPNSCYHILDVTVDSVSQGAISSYPFTNVQANHTINATFAIDTYTINSSAGPNGTISPLGSTVVNCGSSQTYNIAPNACYHIANVVVDGGSVGTNSSYTFTNVQANHTINATFAINTYTITSTAGANGTISPLGATVVNCGSGQTYNITPNSCYHILDVTVDSVSQGAISSYPFTNVQANHTINATFAIDTYSLTTSSSSGGNVTTPGELGPYTYNCGTNAPIIATADPCYSFVNWSGTGVDAGKVANPNSFSTTITMDANYAVYANFVVSFNPTLTLIADPAEGGTPTGGGIYNCSDIVNIFANTDSCYTFVNWTPGDGITNANAENTTVSMTTNRTLTAHYAIKQFTLTTAVSPPGTGTISSGGVYNCGASATVTATAISPYVFDHWSGDLSGNTSPDSITMNANKNVTANFIINPNTVYFQNIGNQTAGSNFSVQVMIYNTSEMFSAIYDVRFNSSILSYQTTNSSSAVGVGTGSAIFQLDPGTLGDYGLLRIIVDYGTYDEGISGSGYLCYINFSTIATGTSSLSFVSGQGNLPGKLQLVKPDESVISPVYWMNGSVTVQ